MKWYKRMTDMRNLIINHESSTHIYPSKLRTLLKGNFEQMWDRERHQNSKLSFYNTIKKSFAFEQYLDISLKMQELKRVAQFRMSAHKYNVETGRYGMKRQNVLYRICSQCSTDDEEALQFLSEFPFFNPIIEDEYHILNICPLYKDERLKAQKIMVKHPLGSKDVLAIFSDTLLIRELSRYLLMCHKKRFPEKEKKKEPQTPKKNKNNGRDE